MTNYVCMYICTYVVRFNNINEFTKFACCVNQVVAIIESCDNRAHTVINKKRYINSGSSANIISLFTNLLRSFSVFYY